MKSIVIIPARLGSKGLLRKNIIEVEGLPLIAYTIKSALEAKNISRVFVSTESQEIASIAKEYGAEVPFLRSQELAQDTSSTIDVIRSFLKNIDAANCYDTLILLQPTQPLIQPFHIEEALLKYSKCKDSVTAISLVKEHPLLMRNLGKDDYLSNVLANSNSTIRRQDFNSIYKVNGMLYICNILEVLNNSKFSFNDSSVGYIIDEKYDVDIDDYLDLEIFKIKLRKLRNNDK